MNKGLLYFAHNNGRLAYTKIATCSAVMAKHFMGNVQTALVTDQQSLDDQPEIQEQLEKAFDKIIVTDNKPLENSRVYRDGTDITHVANFNNLNRFDAYNLSPFDETIVVDSDYLIQNDSLNSCWGSNENLLINKSACSLDFNQMTGEELRLNQTGIRMYWATLIYFKKTDQTRILFDLVNYIRQNWWYYKLIYGFSKSLYRNDFAFSIAIHILSNFMESDSVKSLPTPTIVTATDRDSLVEVDKDSVKMMFYSQQNSGPNLVRLRNTNVHVMNKFSIAVQYEKIMELYA